MTSLKSKYIHRLLEIVVKKQAKHFSAVVITGARQTGKSTLLKHLFGKTHRYITLDDPLLRERALADPELFLDEAGEKVILDEIQLLPELLPYLKIRIDKNRQRKGCFLLTGSHQFNLIRHLTETLAGRTAIFKLYPFSILELSDASKNTHNTSSWYEKACLKSFFPEPFLSRAKDNSIWYSSYLQTYLEKDVRSIYNIGSLREFSQFLRLLAARNAQILGLSGISRDVGVSVNTIKSWLSVLEASHVIYLMQPYHNNFGKRIIKSPKLYFLDNGLVCFLTGIKVRELLYSGPMAGSLFESFVIQETIKIVEGNGVPAVLYYLRTSNGLEVDLIIEHNMRILPVEIKLSKTPKMNHAGNITSLRKLYSKLSIADGMIVTLSDREVRLTRHDSILPLKVYLGRITKLLKSPITKGKFVGQKIA